MQSTYKEGMTKGLTLVKDYWKEGGENEEWREWKRPEEWDNNITKELKTRLNKELDSRRIKNGDGLDILRWGKDTKRTFTTKEAYSIKSKHAQEEDAHNWKQLWKSRWWPKVIMFAWLVGRKRILTWDQIQKRGFSGMRRSSLCNQEG